MSHLFGVAHKFSVSYRFLQNANPRRDDKRDRMNTILFCATATLPNRRYSYRLSFNFHSGTINYGKAYATKPEGY